MAHKFCYFFTDGCKETIYVIIASSSVTINFVICLQMDVKKLEDKRRGSQRLSVANYKS